MGTRSASWTQPVSSAPSRSLAACPRPADNAARRPGCRAADRAAAAGTGARPCRRRTRARAVGPQPCRGAHHRALADAGRAGDEQRLARRARTRGRAAAASRPANRGRDHRPRCPCPLRGRRSRWGAAAASAIRSAPGRRSRALRHRRPGGDVGIGIDDEGQRILHRDEGVDDLHQPAHLYRPREIARRRDEVREDDRRLAVAEVNQLRSSAAP